ncbi:hypothetical protein ACHAXA_001204 [Cyclostephanos tholiformis]|uniref:Guanylate cyclase domain-containing protein n=1 Tax=Cyclostephanos tholiformis TaxID=382380 RepID=A0ABD3SQP6_9STRA
MERRRRVVPPMPTIPSGWTLDCDEDDQDDSDGGVGGDDATSELRHRRHVQRKPRSKDKDKQRGGGRRKDGEEYLLRGSPLSSMFMGQKRGYDDNNVVDEKFDNDDNNFAQHADCSATTGRMDPQPSWDDLQDAISLAMRQSLMVDSHKNDYDDDDDSDVDNSDDIDVDSDTDIDEGGPWNCSACTFLNDNPLHLVCAICGTARLASKLLPSSPTTLSTKSELPGPPPSAPSFPIQKQRPQYIASLEPSKEIAPPKSKPKKQQKHPSQPKRTQNPPSSAMAAMDSIAEDPPPSSRRRKGSQPPLTEQSRDISTSPPRDSEHLASERPPRRKTPSHGSDHSDSETSIASFGKSNANNRRGTSTSLNSKERKERRQRSLLERHHKSFNDSSNDSFNNSFDSRDKRFFVRRSSSDLFSGDPHGVPHKDYNSLRRSTLSGDAPQRKKNLLRRSSIELSNNDWDDGASRSSRRSNRSSKAHPVDFRRSSTEDYSLSDRREARRRFKSYKIRSDPGIGNDAGGSLFSGSDSTDISGDEDSHYLDDKTARTMRTIKTLRIPEGEVTIIYTDVQGSTALWEADPISMKKATDLHDSIIRKCYADHGGYEITTEGDSFNLAFQHPADAIGFALKAQLSLYRANWPEGILNNPHSCFKEKKKFRGFRVRMGMHHGATTSKVHETTGRTQYQGEAVDFAKAIEKMSHGGQILTTVETWRAVSGMAEQYLGSPQVMDCGEHLLYDIKKETAESRKTKRVISKRIVQLVPNSLSYDFFAARGGQEIKEGETPPPVCGRVFPPLLSYGQLSTSFLNAPYIGNRVAMVFVYTDKMESIADKERKKNYKILAKYVRSHLMRLSPPGYECQEDRGSWMLAFDGIQNGIKFGLDLREDVSQNADLSGNVDKERSFRIGIHWGPFLSMGPHTVSGHADYFGPIGQVCVGVPMGDGEEPPDPGPSVDVDVLGSPARFPIDFVPIEVRLGLRLREYDN